MVELKTSSQLQNVSITTNQKRDIEKEKGPNDPEKKKEREETGELINFLSFKLALFGKLLMLFSDKPSPRLVSPSPRLYGFSLKVQIYILKVSTLF